MQYTTEDGAKDIAAFVAIFFEHFYQFKGRPFHMAGESYAVSYAYPCILCRALTSSLSGPLPPSLRVSSVRPECRIGESRVDPDKPVFRAHWYDASIAKAAPAANTTQGTAYQTPSPSSSPAMIYSARTRPSRPS